MSQPSKAPAQVAQEATNDLLRIEAEIKEAFPAARARLEQLVSHLSTVCMVIGHIAEEHERAEAEKALEASK